jgi:hypothetical protein
MGLAIDVGDTVLTHKVFECLVAAEVGDYVVGRQDDDVIDRYENVIIQCKCKNDI